MGVIGTETTDQLQMIDVMRCALATGRAGTSWQVARAAADPGAPEAEAQEARTKWRRSPHQHTWQLTGHELHEQVARPAPGRWDGSAKAKYLLELESSMVDSWRAASPRTGSSDVATYARTYTKVTSKGARRPGSRVQN